MNYDIVSVIITAESALARDYTGMRFQGYTAIELPFECKSIERNSRKLYSLVLEKLQLAGQDVSEIQDSKTLLSRAGFSQNTRNRIIHLSDEEIQTLCDSCPANAALWDFYVREIQTLLSKMVQARQYDSFLGRPPFMGRPYVTAELAIAVRKLTRLRHLEANNVNTLKKPKMRELLVYFNDDASISKFLDPVNSANALTGEAITIQSAIRLLELYRDELIMPPRMMTKQNIDDYTLQMVESNDLGWMDDGGEAFLQALRDVPLETHYDALPDFDPVLDWFIATSPILDKNQIKQGWTYLEKLSAQWHELNPRLHFDENYIADFPGWHCMVTDRHEEWLEAVPPGNPYKLVPLTTPEQLLEESQAMHHCVASYAESCAGGRVRIISVREKGNDKRVATVELARGPTRWEVVQLRGVCNQELLPRAVDSHDPMTAIMDLLAKWYSANKVGDTPFNDSQTMTTLFSQFQISACRFCTHYK